MRILQLIDLYKTGGAEKVYDLFNQYCVSKRHTVSRIVLYGKADGQDTVKYLIQNEHTSLALKLLDQYKAMRLIYRMIKEQAVDHIVSFLDRSNLVVVFACLFNKNRPKITVTIHNPPTVQYLKVNKPIRSLLFFVLSWVYSRKWVKVVAVSRAVKDSLMSIGIKKIYVVYNPLETKEEYPVMADANADKFMLAAGRLDLQKAHWKLIKAFYYYKKTYNDAELKLYIAGAGNLESPLKALSMHLGINHSVVFLGYKSNIIEYINSSKGIIFSSLYEGFPMVLLECMALKKPFIGSEASIPIEIRDILINNTIINTYQTKVSAIDFNGNAVYDDEKELAYLIHKIQTDAVFSNTITNICHDWFCQNCSINNFDAYLV
jgi:glycosyltransferase involved in cell wall biosynthesis